MHSGVRPLMTLKYFRCPGLCCLTPVLHECVRGCTVNRFDRDINDDTRVGIDVSSVYLQDEIELSETLDLVIGGRYDTFKIDVVNVVANETRTGRTPKSLRVGGWFSTGRKCVLICELQ